MTDLYPRDAEHAAELMAELTRRGPQAASPTVGAAAAGMQICWALIPTNTGL